MERTRLSLHHLGKIFFGQMCRAYQPCDEPRSTTFYHHAKGIVIASAAFVAELGYLADPVSTSVQSAEMHNQVVKYVLYFLSVDALMLIYFSPLALISARATISSLEVLSISVSSYLYVLCQGLTLCLSYLNSSHYFTVLLALDLQHEFREGLIKIASKEFFSTAFGSHPVRKNAIPIKAKVVSVLHDTFDATNTMDAAERMHWQKVAESNTTPLLDFFTGPSFSNPSLLGPALTSIPTFHARVASQAYFLLDDLRSDYPPGARGADP